MGTSIYDEVVIQTAEDLLKEASIEPVQCDNSIAPLEAVAIDPTEDTVNEVDSGLELKTQWRAVSPAKTGKHVDMSEKAVNITPSRFSALETEDSENEDDAIEPEAGEV
ncbi:unnamed protein product [Arabis nemorensis]|uniref:Uncharacterized protein n=1 Tax=Arabis nemorensis TaxID=586526 RepID=A0A565BAQ2_9BRAS|nr:unnamed protein product [Arabis nemorensis]